MLMGLLATAAATSTAPQEEAENRSVEGVIADLIEKTNGLHSYRVLYEGEEEPAIRLELLYEHPSRAKLDTSSQSDQSSFAIVDGIMLVRGKSEFVTLDMGPDLDDLRELDQRLFRVIAEGELRVRTSILNLEQARLMVVLPFKDSKSDAVLSWLDSMATRPETCRLEGDQIVHSVNDEPRAYVSRKDGFPTRLRRKDGKWLVRRELETAIDLSDAQFGVSDPVSGSKDTSEGVGDQMAIGFFGMYRIGVYEVLIRHPDRWSSQDLATSWKDFHRESLRRSNWQARFEQSFDEFSKWVQENRDAQDLEKRIADWKRDTLDVLDKGRENYLKSLQLPENFQKDESALQSLVIERNAAEQTYKQLVGEYVERRCSELVSSKE